MIPTKKKKAFKILQEKGENAKNQHILPFPTMCFPCSIQNQLNVHSSPFKLLLAVAFSLDKVVL